MSKEELLKAISTRQLLSTYKRYRFSDWGIPFSRLVEGGEMVNFTYTAEEVKKELDSRPHIPNKNEARGLRLKKIREGV